MELPLFPLHVVLFPGASLPLRVFEPRYLAMMERVLASDRRFGVIAIKRGLEVGGAAETYDVGCRAVIQELSRSDGQLEIVVAGIERFRVERRLPDDPYPAAVAELIHEVVGEDVETALASARAAIDLYRAAIARLQGHETPAAQLPDGPVEASFALASGLHVDLPEIQRLLEAPDAAARLRLTEELARREAMLLETIGPPVARPEGRFSPN